LWLFLAPRASASLTIKATYDSSITTQTNAAAIENALSRAVQNFEDLYTNDVTINLTFYWGPAGPFTNGIALGRSEYSLIFTTYPGIVSALSSHRASAADTNSVASLPAVDPTGSGNRWLVCYAEAKVLGLRSATDPANDGDVGFSTNVSYTFDPNNRIASGKYDLIGVAEHEISEVLGRNTLNLGTNFVPYDLFRFTSNGTRNFNPAATNVYFSVDNGVTALRFYYTNESLGDIQDWKSLTNADSDDAFVPSGRLLPISGVDIMTLDVLGYNGPGLTPPPRPAGTRLSNGNFVLKFAETPGSNFTVLATTNLTMPLTNWTVLGKAIENPPGLFRFTDSPPASIERFYEVRSP